MCFIRSQGPRELIATASGDDAIHIFEKVRASPNIHKYMFGYIWPFSTKQKILLVENGF